MNDMVAVVAQPSLHERATRIRSLVNVARHCIHEIGKELIVASETVPRGEWGNWLRLEFDWNIKTAQRYIDVVEAFKSDTMSFDFDTLTIDATAFYALSAPDVPQAARDEAVARAQAGEQISKADADALIAEAERAIEVKLLTAFEAQRDENAKQLKKSFAKAEQRYADDTLRLTEEIARIKAAQSDPDVPQAIEIFCKILGKQKLTAKQLRLLAQVIESPITDGKRTYHPVSEPDRQMAETNLAIAAAAERAIDYFATAPAPDVVAAAMHPAQHQRLRPAAKATVEWLKLFATFPGSVS